MQKDCVKLAVSVTVYTRYSMQEQLKNHKERSVKYFRYARDQ